MLDVPLFSPARCEAVERTISEAEVPTFPYPYLYVTDLFTPQECEAISAHWPAKSSMALESEELQRSYLELVHDDTVQIDQVPEAVRPFWNDMLRGPLAAMLRGIADAFAPYIDAKRGDQYVDEIALQIHRMMCLEAEQGFVEHIPHHHPAAPNWGFTALLYIDDIGREDRGTTLYRPSGAVDLENRPNDVYAGLVYAERPHSVFDAKFRQGALLAFFESALSIHGSTPFQNSGADCSRRIVRSHIALGPREVEAVYGLPTAELNRRMVEAFHKYKANDLTAYDGIDLRNETELLKIIAGRRRPMRRDDLRIVFPALERGA